MKRLFALFVFAGALAAQQTTPNLGLIIQTPPQYPNNWGAIVNYDLQKIDTAAPLTLYQGTWSSTVTYTKSMMVTYSGVLYVSTLNGNLNNTPGSSGAWVATGGGSSNVFPNTNGIVFNTSQSASRNAAFADVVALWASGSCTSGYLKFDGTCSTPAAGLADPGSNGVIKRTALNVTGPATFADIVALFGSGSCSGFLKSDGTCSTPSGGSPAGSTYATQYNAGSGAFGGSGPGTTGQVWTSNGPSTPPSFQVLSGVQYNPSNTAVVIMGGSNNGDDQGNTLGPTITLTSWSCNSVTCSFLNTGTNHLSVGDWVFLRYAGSWPNNTTLNTGVTLFQVTSAGLSSTTFQVAFGSSYSFTGSGTGGSVEIANGFLPVQISREPFFNGHSSMSFIGDTAQSLAANFNTVVGTAPTTPAFLVLTSLWTNDIGASRTASQIETDLQTVWTSAHSNGWTVVQGFDYPIQWNTTSGLGNPNAFQTWFAVYKWIQGQGWNVFNVAPWCSTTCGQYWDRSVDNASILRDAANTNLSNNGNLGVLSAGGVKRLADYYNAAFANQGSMTGSFPWYEFPVPFSSGSLYGNTFGIGFAPTSDSHQCFSWYNASFSMNYINIDCTSGIIQMPVITPSVSSVVTIAPSNGQLGAKTIQGTDAGILAADSTNISSAATGTPLCKSSLGGATTLSCTSPGITNTTTTVGTTAISPNSCTSAITATMTGLLTSSVLIFTPSTDISTVTGWGSTGGLTIVAWPTANTLNYKVCNQTSSSITPSASVTFNVGAR